MSYSGVPDVPPPWVAEWDGSSQRYYFVNQQSGERTWNNPTGQFDDAVGQAVGYEADRIEQGVNYVPDRIESGWNEARYDGQRAENYVDNKVYDGVQDVENAPENGARWAGSKVDEVEGIPGDVASWTERKEQEIEDVPEDVAGWAGEQAQVVEDIPGDVSGWVQDKVGDVERLDDRVDNYGDGLENAYDQGRDERRDDDDDRY